VLIAVGGATGTGRGSQPEADALHSYDWSIRGVTR
jgi:hypothetical protein